MSVLRKQSLRRKNANTISVADSDEASFHSGLSTFSRRRHFSSPWKYRKLSGDDTVSLINSSMESDDIPWTVVSTTNHSFSESTRVYEETQQKIGKISRLWSLACLLNCPRQRRVPVSSSPTDMDLDHGFAVRGYDESLQFGEKEKEIRSPICYDFATFSEHAYGLDGEDPPRHGDFVGPGMYSVDLFSELGERSVKDSSGDSQCSANEIVKEQHEFAQMLEFWLRQAQKHVDRDEIALDQEIITTKTDNETKAHGDQNADERTLNMVSDDQMEGKTIVFSHEAMTVPTEDVIAMEHDAVAGENTEECMQINQSTLLVDANPDSADGVDAIKALNALNDYSGNRANHNGAIDIVVTEDPIATETSILPGDDVIKKDDNKGNLQSSKNYAFQSNKSEGSNYGDVPMAPTDDAVSREDSLAAEKEDVNEGKESLEGSRQIEIESANEEVCQNVTNDEPDKDDVSKQESNHIQNLIMFWNKAEPKRLGKPRLPEPSASSRDHLGMSTSTNGTENKFTSQLTAGRIQASRGPNHGCTSTANDDDWLTRLTVSRMRHSETFQKSESAGSTIAASQTSALISFWGNGVQQNRPLQKKARQKEEEINFWNPRLFGSLDLSKSVSFCSSCSDGNSSPSVKSDSSISWFGTVGLDSIADDGSTQNLSIYKRLRNYEAEKDPEDADFEESHQRRSPPLTLDGIDYLVTQLSKDYLQALSGLESSNM